MANAAPATLTITGSTGPGQSVTSQKFTDVVDVEADFFHNVLRVTRSGAGGIIIYDYSALATITWTISGGVSTLVFS